MGVWVRIYQLLTKALQVLIAPFKDSKHDGVVYPAIIKRFGAWFLDVIFIVTLSFLVMNIAKFAFLGGQSPYQLLIIEIFLSLAIMSLYFVISNGVWRKTLGKFMFGIEVLSIKVVDSNVVEPTHQRAKSFQSAAREVFKIGLCIAGPVLFVMGLLSKKRRMAWDFLSNTVVGYCDKVD